MILAHKEREIHSEESHEGWSVEVVENVSGVSESVEVACGGNCAHRKVKTKETDGSSSTPDLGRGAFRYCHAGIWHTEQKEALEKEDL